MLPRILPATLNPKALTANKTDNTDKNTSNLNDDGNDERIPDNGMEKNTGSNKIHKNFCNSVKSDIVDTKAIHTDKLPDKNNTKLNNVLTRNTKVCKSSASRMSSGSPQIRKTTPRLAKTRSAQNMKLMAQVLGSKSSSNCTTLKSKEKGNVDKTITEGCANSKIVSRFIALC